MKWYEIVAALKYQNYAIQDSWEQARLIAYIMAQVNSTKHLKMQDIIEFPWDNLKGVTESQPISKEDAERINKKTEELINKGLV